MHSTSSKTRKRGHSLTNKADTTSTTKLRYLERYYPGHEGKKKKTVSQEIYCEEMCRPMFHGIKNVMDDKIWTWQQVGAKAHTARALIQFF